MIKDCPFETHYFSSDVRLLERSWPYTGLALEVKTLPQAHHVHLFRGKASRNLILKDSKSRT
jgi:hypothetical protein